MSDDPYPPLAQTAIIIGAVVIPWGLIYLAVKYGVMM